jgi:hypothetical protein
VDPQALAIFTAGDAVWVAISTGCRGSACEKWTLVLDPRSLTMAGVFAGGATDVAVSGTRAYALLDVPGEVAAFDISKPLQPSLTAHIPSPAGAKSIAATASTVLVLGEKLDRYTLSLSPNGEFLESSTATQQQIEIAGSCAIVIGRKDNPEMLDPVTITGASPLIEVPSTARSLAAQGSRLYVLTEHSIEVWSPVQPPAVRRRSAR